MVIDVNSKEKFNYFLKKLLFYVSLHFFWSRTAGPKGPKLSNAAEWKKSWFYLSLFMYIILQFYIIWKEHFYKFIESML